MRRKHFDKSKFKFAWNCDYCGEVAFYFLEKPKPYSRPSSPGVYSGKTGKQIPYQSVIACPFCKQFPSKDLSLNTADIYPIELKDDE